MPFSAIIHCIHQVENHSYPKLLVVRHIVNWVTRRGVIIKICHVVHYLFESLYKVLYGLYI